MKKFTDAVKKTEKKVSDLSKPFTGQAHKKIIKMPDFLNAPDTENVSLSTLVTTSLTNIQNPSDFQNEFLYNTEAEYLNGTGNYSIRDIKSELDNGGGNTAEAWYMLEIDDLSDNQIRYVHFNKPADLTAISPVKIMKENSDGTYTDMTREVETITSSEIKIWFRLPKGVYFVGFNTQFYLYNEPTPDWYKPEVLVNPTTDTTMKYMIQHSTGTNVLTDGTNNYSAYSSWPSSVNGDNPIRKGEVTGFNLGLYPTGALSTDDFTAWIENGGVDMIEIKPIKGQHILPDSCHAMMIITEHDPTRAADARFEILDENKIWQDKDWQGISYYWPNLRPVNDTSYPPVMILNDRTSNYYGFDTNGNPIAFDKKKQGWEVFNNSTDSYGIKGFAWTYNPPTSYRVYGLRQNNSDYHNPFTQDTWESTNSSMYETMAMNIGRGALRALDTNKYVGKKFLVPFSIAPQTTLPDYNSFKFVKAVSIWNVDYLNGNSSATVSGTIYYNRGDDYSMISDTFTLGSGVNNDGCHRVVLDDTYPVAQIETDSDVIIMFEPLDDDAFYNNHSSDPDWNPVGYTTTFIPAVDTKDIMGHKFSMLKFNEQTLNYDPSINYGTYKVIVFQANTQLTFNGTTHNMENPGTYNISAIQGTVPPTLEATSPVALLHYGGGTGATDNGYPVGMTNIVNFSQLPYIKQEEVTPFQTYKHLDMGPNTANNVAWEYIFDVTDYFTEAGSLHWKEYRFDTDSFTSKITTYVSYSLDNVNWSTEYIASNNSALPGTGNHGDIRYIKVRFEVVTDPTATSKFTDDHYMKDIKLVYYTYMDISI